jgi:hypothetical protein
MMDVRNINGEIFDAILPDYLLYGLPYHDGIEEEDSK